MKNRLVYAPLWILVVVVLAVGMFLPKLMDYDAAEYAGIAMHMEQQGDYTNIINRTYATGDAYDYLDKPHVLFWSTWPGFKLFGIGHAGYRLVSILMSLLAAFATARLGSLLYNKRVGQIAALMFISSQAILLANHDVRTDSLLTSFVVLAVWQLVLYVQQGKWWQLIWAGAFLAGGVGTKGMIAVMVAGCVLFFYLLARRDWGRLFHWHWLVLVASFFLFLSPVMFYYYQQFDLHPEKLVNGATGMSGIKFLLWTQSFERFAGDRTFVDNPEFSFFFHTILWALLPWSVLYYAATFKRLSGLWKSKGKSFFTLEQLSFAGTWMMFLVMSKSSFKLPHYLNVLFPFMTILTAAFLYQLLEAGKLKLLRSFQMVQWGIVIILGILMTVINGWAFPMGNLALIISTITFLGIAIVLAKLAINDEVDKIWVPSFVAIMVVNFILNAHFYPAINAYQGGSTMAAYIKENKMDTSSIYLYNETVRSFDFYLQNWRPMVTNRQIDSLQQQGKAVVLFTHDRGLDTLQQAFTVESIHRVPDFHITGLNGKFLNPSTRQQSHGYMHLVRVAGHR